MSSVFSTFNEGSPSSNVVKASQTIDDVSNGVFNILIGDLCQVTL